MLSVELIRKKAATPYTKRSYPELEKLTATLPELFSKNAFAPIFKSSVKATGDELAPGDAAHMDPPKKQQSNLQLEMRYDDYVEATEKQSPNKKAPEGPAVIRSTLENPFMEEGIRDPQTFQKKSPPFHPQAHPSPNDFARPQGFYQEGMPSPQMMMPRPRPGHPMYPQHDHFDPQIEGEEEQVVDFEDYEMQQHYRHPMSPAYMGGPNQPFHMSPQHPYYAQPGMGHGHVQQHQVGIQGMAAGKPAKKASTPQGNEEDGEEQVEGDVEDIENASPFINQTPGENDEIDGGYPYNPQDRYTSFHHQPLYGYNYEYMPQMSPHEMGNMQGDMHGQHFGYPNQGFDPRYNPNFGNYDSEMYYPQQNEYEMGYDPMYGNYGQGMQHDMGGYHQGMYDPEQEEYQRPPQKTQRGGKGGKNTGMQHQGHIGDNRTGGQNKSKIGDKKNSKNNKGKNTNQQGQHSSRGQPGSNSNLPGGEKTGRPPGQSGAPRTPLLGNDDGERPVQYNKNKTYNAEGDNRVKRGGNNKGQMGSYGQQRQATANQNPNMTSPHYRQQHQMQQMGYNQPVNRNPNMMGQQMMNPMMNQQYGGYAQGQQNPQMGGQHQNPKKKKNQNMPPPQQMGDFDEVDEYEDAQSPDGPNGGNNKKSRRQVFFLKK